MERLAAAKSNLPDNRDGKTMLRKWVKPAGYPRSGAGHYAIISFRAFWRAPDYCYNVEREDYTLEVREAKNWQSVARVSIRVTTESASLGFAVLHLGDHNTRGASHFERSKITIN